MSFVWPAAASKYSAACQGIVNDFSDGAAIRSDFHAIAPSKVAPQSIVRDLKRLPGEPGVTPRLHLIERLQTVLKVYLRQSSLFVFHRLACCSGRRNFRKCVYASSRHLLMHFSNRFRIFFSWITDTPRYTARASFFRSSPTT